MVSGTDAYRASSRYASSWVRCTHVPYPARVMTPGRTQYRSTTGYPWVLHVVEPMDITVGLRYVFTLVYITLRYVCCEHTYLGMDWITRATR